MNDNAKLLRAAGEMYCPDASAELMKEYNHAAELVFKYNNICFTDAHGTELQNLVAVSL